MARPIRGQRRPPGSSTKRAGRTSGGSQLNLGGSIKRRRERAKGTRQFRLHAPHWIDPYPFIPGTDPEKRIFDALVKSHIYFQFHFGSPKEAGELLLRPYDRDIDFTLPEYKVIIDPFSPFHHSQAESVKRDAEKAAIHAAAGYITYHPWAIGNGIFVLDQNPMDVGIWRDGKPVLVKNKKGELVLLRRHTAAVPHIRAYGAIELLAALPAIQGGPRFKLTDPEDIKAKRSPGYRLGAHLGAGAKGVALANRSRRRPPSLGLKRT